MRAALFAVSLMLLPAPILAGAAHAEGLTAEQTIQTEKKVTLADGTVKIERVPAELVKPGDTVYYTINYNNGASEPVEAFDLVMPVPAELIYLEGSADNDKSVTTYSADGGLTYSARGSLVVSNNNVQRPATSADVTHVRWVFKQPIAPGEKGEVSFGAVLK